MSSLWLTILFSILHEGFYQCKAPVMDLDIKMQVCGMDPLQVRVLNPLMPNPLIYHFKIHSHYCLSGPDSEST